MARDNPAISWIRLELLNAYPSLVQSLRARGHADEARTAIRLAREEIERLPRISADDLISIAYWRVASSKWHGGKESEKPTETERAEQSREADLAIDALRQALSAGYTRRWEDVW